eukprot:373673-Amphidinium_carterae.5
MSKTTTMILEPRQFKQIATILICLHYSYIGSTSSPIEAVRQVSIWTMPQRQRSMVTSRSTMGTVAKPLSMRRQSNNRRRDTLTMMGQPPQVPHRHLQCRSQWRLRSRMQLQLLNKVTLQCHNLLHHRRALQSLQWQCALLNNFNFIWKVQMTGQCSPITRQALHCGEYISQGANNHKFVALTSRTVELAIIRDNYLPAMAKADNCQYQHWYSTGQLAQSRASRRFVGTMSTSISGCAICQSTPSIWQSIRGGTYNQMTLTIRICQCTCCAGDRQCPTFSANRTLGHDLTAMSTIDELRTFQLSSIRSTQVTGTTPRCGPRSINIKQLMGATLGTWELAGWSKADNGDNGTLWLDHSVYTWMTTSTQWHVNAYSAITMLNTKSMTHSDNGVTTMAQYVTADAGVECDPQVKHGGDNGWQWRSPATIMNSQLTMNIEAANGV